MAPVLIKKATGLNTQPNELAVEPGSLSVAENVEITRDDVIEVSRGFEDYSSNLPGFTPEQLISLGGTAYLHLDGGIWYQDGTEWQRKVAGALWSDFINSNMWADSANAKLYTFARYCLYQIDLNSGNVQALAGKDNTTGTTDATGSAARFTDPFGIVGDGAGNLFICDRHAIRKVVISTGVVTTLAGNVTASGNTNNTGTAARFNTVVGIACDGTNLYVADAGNHDIRKIVISTGVVTTFAGTGVAGNADGTGTGASFTGPNGIAYDGSANLYVFANNAIRKIVVSSQVVTTFAGLSGTPGTTDATGTAARFGGGYALAHDGNGNLWVGDYDNDSLRKIVVSSAVVSTPVSAGVGNLLGIAPYNSGASLFLGVATGSRIKLYYTSTADLLTIAGNGDIVALPSSFMMRSFISGPS
jgi:hypothetical protein